MSVINEIVKDDKPRYTQRSKHDLFLGCYGELMWRSKMAPLR